MPANNARRPVPAEAIDLIKPSEELRLLAYDDKQPKIKKPARIIGVPTIGYGHTKTVKPEDVGVKRITPEEAETLFAQDLAEKVVEEIYGCLTHAQVMRLNEHQWAALCDFVFNCGLKPQWKLTQLLRAGRLGEVPDQLIRFVNSGGVRMQGLVDRRRKEVDLWRMADTGAGPVDGPVEMAPAKPLFQSRTFITSIVGGLSGVGAAATGAVQQLHPLAAGNHTLTALLTGLVIITTASTFLIGFLRAQDTKGASA